MKPPGAVRLQARITGVSEALRQCAAHHRHLPRCAGGLVGVEVIRRDTRWPVAWGIIGRPVSRYLQADGWVEYSRGIVPVTAPPNCASVLLGAAARWAAGQGAPIVTYTLAHEPGVSLRAAGWALVGATPAAQWTRESRSRKIRAGVVVFGKLRWVSAASLPAALSRGWAIMERT
jgi:hypothetical protein